MGAAPEPLLVLYTGRLVERKGIRDLLAAIPAVLEQFPDTRFVLAGGQAVAQVSRRVQRLTSRPG